MASIDSSTANGHSESNGLSAAEKLQQRHAEHKVEVEEIPDEADLRHPVAPLSGSVLEGPGDDDATAPGWVAPISAKAAGKRKEEVPSKLNLEAESDFPSLGGSGASKAPAQAATWNKAPNGASTPSRVQTPPAGPQIPRQAANVPAGQKKVDYPLQKNHIKARQDLKKPIPDIIKEINKKYRKVTVSQSANDKGITLTAIGPSIEAAQQAIREVVSQIGAKISEKVQIPQSARAHIIGKAGSKIKEIQERTGARIQIPKVEDTPTATEEDEDPEISIAIEGNALSVADAQQEIIKIAGERTATVNSKLRTIPAEFYPFLRARQGDLEGRGVQLEVPHYHTWTSQPPPQKAAAGKGQFQPAPEELPIGIAGDRKAVQAAKDEIESLISQLKTQSEVHEVPIEKGRHQFIIGNRGVSADDFFGETGCSIILPHGDDDDTITIVGPPGKIEAAENHAMSLHSQIQAMRADLSKNGRNAPDASAQHVKNLTQYLRERRAIQDLEELHQVHIDTSLNQATPWELYSRNYANNANASKDIRIITQAHPPSKFATVDVDPFYHPHLRTHVLPKVRNDYGVHVVVPQDAEPTPILLVFEGAGSASPFQVARDIPSAEEVKKFQQSLQAARQQILDIFANQAQIIAKSVEVPLIFHGKLKRFIKEEQDIRRENDQIPIRVSASGTTVTLRGPGAAVEELADKVNAWVEQAIQDEKERGFTLSFDFPQKHANQLIGKGGSYIRELRDKFDVEINVKDGVVELKGPKAKAESAKSHISALGRQWADEATHVLIIDPKHHAELIGSQGNQIKRLQTRYKVQIHFPRSREDDGTGENERKGPKQAPNEVIVKGPKKGADEARGELLDLVQHSVDNSNTATVSVQQSQIPSLIGEGGKHLLDIRTSSGAKIDIPKDSKDPSARVDIQIKGTKSQVAQAKKLIEEQRVVYDDMVTQTLEVAKKHHKSLIGREGSAIRDIVVQAGGPDDRRAIARIVRIPRAESDETSVKIEGNKDVVAKIAAAIEQFVSERDNQTTDSIDIPTEKHRNLIGRGGEIKRELESKFKVALDIPRIGTDQKGVKITGLPSDVEKAKAHILDLVKEQEGETIQVPLAVHNRVADGGAYFRKAHKIHQVTIGHDGVKPPPKASSQASRTNGSHQPPLITDEESADTHEWRVESAANDALSGEIPWVLRGSAENVAKVRAQIHAAIEEAQRNQIGYLRLADSRNNRYVIGKQGAKVNSIRNATGCNITVPRDSSDGDAIEISGSAEGIEKAKDLVLEAVKEGASRS